MNYFLCLLRVLFAPGLSRVSLDLTYADKSNTPVQNLAMFSLDPRFLFIFSHTPTNEITSVTSRFISCRVNIQQQFRYPGEPSHPLIYQPPSLSCPSPFVLYEIAYAVSMIEMSLLDFINPA